jgi:hypothetical protein
MDDLQPKGLRRPRAMTALARRDFAPRVVARVCPHPSGMARRRPVHRAGRPGHRRTLRDRHLRPDLPATAAIRVGRLPRQGVAAGRRVADARRPLPVDPRPAAARPAAAGQRPGGGVGRAAGHAQRRHYPPLRTVGWAGPLVRLVVARRRRVRAGPRQTVRPLYGRAASDNLGSLKVLRRAGFRDIRTEISYANARGAEIEETVLRLE